MITKVLASPSHLYITKTQHAAASLDLGLQAL